MQVEVLLLVCRVLAIVVSWISLLAMQVHIKMLPMWAMDVCSREFWGRDRKSFFGF
jgi:hypothetical protein